MDAVANTLVISCAVIVVLYAWKMIDKVWLRPKKLERILKKQGFNGNKYKLFFGDTKELFSQLSKSSSLNKHIDIDNGEEVLSHVMAFPHHSLQKHGRSFITWMGWTPRVTILEPELMKDVLTKSNDFQRIRGNPIVRLSGTGLITLEGEQWNMVPAFHLSCCIMLGKWEKLISSTGACELDVWPHLQALTSDVISRTAFGSSYEEGFHIFELLTKQSVLVMELLRSLYIPGSRFLPTKKNKRMKAIRKEVNHSIKTIIDNRLKEMKVGKSNFDDLLGIMLESNMEEVTMIFYEVLRLYPPAPGTARVVNKDTALGRFSLPSGTQIALPVMLIHYDEQFWGSDAKKFNPNRFSEGISKATKNQGIYFPFGWGPRICIGQNFALIEAKLALAMILQRFSFEFAPSYLHAPNIILTLQPKYGAPLILHKL
ncbi:hypothetical protein QVD17_23834 [Tagetes erecta]|uniref:Cytochrome P450 n=1 Tax=Tagetes erecta TaxID=13708 RepID=A0AAD8KEI6_TARER|nr:hypothetical protein QVD17_23834 [Tagetes erecta]